MGGGPVDTRLVVLNRLLEALAVPVDVTSIDARKKMQKAVYLAQASGLKLGYAYGWYLLGPYSTGLARDYYALASTLGPDAPAGAELRDDVRAGLAPLREALNVPQGVQLSAPQWFELLSSVHFLRKVRGLTTPDANLVLLKEKPEVAPFADRAAEALGAAQLL